MQHEAESNNPHQSCSQLLRGEQDSREHKRIPSSLQSTMLFIVSDSFPFFQQTLQSLFITEECRCQYLIPFLLLLRSLDSRSMILL